MITQSDINSGRCYWYAAIDAGGNTVVKRNGISIPGFKLKDGAVVKDEKRYDLVTQLKQKSSSRVKVVKRVK